MLDAGIENGCGDVEPALQAEGWGMTQAASCVWPEAQEVPVVWVTGSSLLR